MPRYDIVDLSRTIYLAKEEFKKDIKKYEEYLKVSGNNYKYPNIYIQYGSKSNSLCRI